MQFTSEIEVWGHVATLLAVAVAVGWLGWLAYSGRLRLRAHDRARRHAEERVRILSSYDALTALPNRRLFRERLEWAVARAQAEPGSLALLVLDLGRVGQVNDLLGHEGGDRVLAAVVDRIAEVADAVALVGRIGGDEFALLLEPGAGSERAATVAQKVLASVALPYETEGHSVALDAGIGIAVFPGDGADAGSLMKNAEIAAHGAMREGGYQFRFFSPAMDAELRTRRKLEHDLARAVPRGELALVYQPIVSTGGRRIVGLEALVRWKRNGGAVVGPAEFVPLAEETGLIGAIGDWVLIEACRQARAWAEQGIPAVPVAVNVSPAQMKARDLPARIRRALETTRLPADRLEIELTESAVVDDPEAAQRLLGEIKALGVRLAVDDFGTGYSSLARLKHFPVDKLKIDRTFVTDVARDASDAAIARAVVALGHGLGLTVVSEGVESEEQFRYLEGEGCDAVQGYLFSPPVEAGKAAELLRRGGFGA